MRWALTGRTCSRHAGLPHTERKCRGVVRLRLRIRVGSASTHHHCPASISSCPHVRHRSVGAAVEGPETEHPVFGHFAQGGQIVRASNARGRSAAAARDAVGSLDGWRRDGSQRLAMIGAITDVLTRIGEVSCLVAPVSRSDLAKAVQPRGSGGRSRTGSRHASFDVRFDDSSSSDARAPALSSA